MQAAPEKGCARASLLLLVLKEGFGMVIAAVARQYFNACGHEWLTT
jgi:hypothetical protein